MNRFIVPVPAICLLLSHGVRAPAEPAGDRARVLAEIEKLGGKVTVEEARPGRPVVGLDISTTGRFGRFRGDSAIRGRAATTPVGRRLYAKPCANGPPSRTPARGRFLAFAAAVALALASAVSWADEPYAEARAAAYKSWLGRQAADYAGAAKGAGKPVAGVVVEAYLAPKRPEPGRPVTLVMSVKNLGNHPVPVFLSGDGNCYVFAHGDGGPVALTELGRREWTFCHDLSGSPGSTTCIRPGFAMGAAFPLARYFILDARGGYTFIPSLWLGRQFSRLSAAPVAIDLRGPAVGATRTQPPLGAPAAGGQPSGRQGAVAGAAPGRVGDFALDAVLSPTDRAAVNLVVSLRNVRWQQPLDCNREVYSYSDDYRHGYPFAGVDPGAGKATSDYRLVVHDASGATVAMSDAGRSWMHKHQIPHRALIAPGEAIGFVAPLRSLFPLLAGGEYSVVVSLPRDRGRGPLFAPAVTFRVPGPEVEGENRPPLASRAAWRRLLELARRSESGPSLESGVSFRACAEERQAWLSCRFRNKAASAASVELPPAGAPYDLILVRDISGNPVLPCENAKTMHPIGAIDDSRSERFLRESDPIAYPLALAYSLEPGRRYSVLAAVRYRSERELLAVAEPVAFTVPADAGGEAPPAPGGAMALPPAPPAEPTFDQRWETSRRFAGKAFEGLQLGAVATRGPTGVLIRLAVTLFNRSAEPITVKKWSGASDVEVLIRDPSGEPLRPNEKGRKFFGGATTMEFRALQPGDSIEAVLPLSDLFDFKPPGQYAILVSLPVLGDVDAVLTAAPLKIHVP